MEDEVEWSHVRHNFGRYSSTTAEHPFRDSLGFRLGSDATDLIFYR